MGSNIRISHESVEDSIHNDGANYRVIAQQPSRDGTFSEIFTQGVDAAVFHGPTSLYLVDNGEAKDPRTTTIEGVETIISTSADGSYIDKNHDFGYLDFYNNSIVNGSYPMMMVQEISPFHYVVVSGESIISDYKNMYGLTTERGIGNGGLHQGKVLVDNIFGWFAGMEYVEQLPFNPVIIGLSTVAFIVLIFNIRRFRS
ncbi:MAG: hypothetical protein ACXAE3_16855 [Candidatus Kariarchaeaceae archaeon]